MASSNYLGSFSMGSMIQIHKNQFWTHLKQIGSLSWTLLWTLAYIFGSSNHYLSLLALFVGFQPIDFASKMVPWKFSLDLPLFGLGLSSKGHGFDLWLSSNGWDGALFHWTWTLDPHLKWPLDIANRNDKCNCHHYFFNYII